MDIKPIRTKANYRAALKDIESLMAAKANTPEGDRLDVLTTLVEAYERAHFPMDLPDAVEAIKFRMEQSGLTVKDLEPLSFIFLPAWTMDQTSGDDRQL
jgi:HTH-type transcriptional regulator / antitoxin HigA